MKKILIALAVVLILLLVGYLFIWQPNYQVSFNTKQPPGVVFEHIKDWSIFSRRDSIIVSIEEEEAYHTLKQKVKIQDSIFDYQWNIARQNDSITKVTVKIKDTKNHFKQKFSVPFSKNNFVKRSVANVKNVGYQLNRKEENFKVHSIADTVLPPTYCAYIPVKSTTRNKAQNMLRDIAGIMGYIKGNEIPLIGDPFLQVTHWDQKTDSIHFNFCFPIAKNDSLPKNPNILFQTTQEQKMLKAIFNGNYRISNYGWYYLIDYAQRNNLEIDLLPTEIFLNDPHGGGNSLEWNAHILVPLK